MHLFYHYMTSVATNTGDDQLWQRQLPRIAFRHHTILHLLLAIAALHLARSEPRQSAELISKAEAHMNVGLRRATQDLSTLDENNCAELYIITILICTYTFAKKPGPRNLLVVAEGHESAWWELFRGVRVIIERVGLPTILARLAQDTGTHNIVQPSTLPQPQQETVMNVLTPLDWENALESLVILMEQAPSDRKNIYQDTFNMLKWCYHGTFGMMGRSHVVATPKYETIMAWLYVLDDKYVDMLKDNDPLAMLLLAYFAVLLQTLETVWFLKGWALHILCGVRGILIETSREQWLHWLRWPETQVNDLVKITSTMIRL